MNTSAPRNRFIALLIGVLGLVAISSCQPKNSEQTAELGSLPVVASHERPGSNAPSDSLRATIFSTTGATTTGEFDLPQVKLPNARAAARINQFIIAHFAAMNSDTLSRTPRQAIRRAQAVARKNNDQGFVGYHYEVLYNAHGILSLALNITELGAHEVYSSLHATFALRTGQSIPLAALVADTVALRRNWQQQLNESTAEAVETAKQQFGADTAAFAYFKKQVSWNDRTRTVTAERAGWEPDFALTYDGMTIYSSYDLPLPWGELQPQIEYPFIWDELRPWWHQSGPWRNLPFNADHK